MRSKPFRFYLSWLSTLVVLTILPLIIWHLDLPFIEETFDGSAPRTIASQPFEIFAFFMSVLLVALTYFKSIKSSKKTLLELLPSILLLLVCLSLLFVQVETFQSKSSDFMCYENAARAILSDLNPYKTTPQCYLYPPLLAQILAKLHQFSTNTSLLSWNDESRGWTDVAYFFQCGQFFQIVLGYYLTFLLAKDLRSKPSIAALLAAALFLFNYPLLRTVTFDQVNLWLLNSFLLGIVLVQRQPFFAGLAVALGAHIKLYTLILLLPWSFTKRWKAILGVLVGFASIAFIQTEWGRSWSLWQDFLEYFKSPEKPSNYRNNGLWSLIFNLSKIPNHFFDSEVFDNVVPLIYAGLVLCIFIVFSFRFRQREQVHQALKTLSKKPEQAQLNDTFRMYGHSIDAIALSLLISPSVWEHHYVLAIPVALFALSVQRSHKICPTLLSLFLIFDVPTFEIFPLSFHRLLGLIMLVYLTSPLQVQEYFLRKRVKNNLLFNSLS